MSIQDPISNLLSAINNAQARLKDKLVISSSSQKINLLKLLKQEGYISNFEITEDKKPKVAIFLKYFEGEPVIRELKRISRPGLRQYVGKKELPLIKGGLGIAVVSTNKGLMTDKEAREEGLGGEIICSIF
tara:strand:- start:201 stop:593 length:393 start_codon:yes stop_codon:yes gene_type:complete